LIVRRIILIVAPQEWRISDRQECLIRTLRETDQMNWKTWILVVVSAAAVAAGGYVFGRQLSTSRSRKLDCGDLCFDIEDLLFSLTSVVWSTADEICEKADIKNSDRPAGNLKSLGVLKNVSAHPFLVGEQFIAQSA
jgi:heme A synthase